MPQPDDDPITSLEHSVGVHLSSQVHGACLDAEALVELAVLGRKGARYDAGIAHIVTCPSCRELLRTYQGMERLEAAGRDVQSSHRPNVNFRPRILAIAGFAAVVAAILLLAPRRTIVSLHDNGGEIRLTAGGNLSGITGLSSNEIQAVAAELQSGSVAPAAILASLKASSAKTTDAFAVTGPRTTVVDTVKPEFTWKMPANAVSCRVTLADITDPAHSVRSKPLKAEKWAPKKPLIRGDIYAWELVALDKRGKQVSQVPSTSGAARFKVLETSRSAELSHERETLGRSHLAMGAVYAQEGMLDDAEREFNALSRANPDSAVAKSLFESVAALRG